MLRPALSASAVAAVLALAALCGGCGTHQIAQPVSSTSSSPSSPSTGPSSSPSATPTHTPLPPPVHNGPLVVRPSGGRATAARGRYPWVVEGTPAEQYTITEIQGLSPHDAVKALGRIHTQLGDLTGLGALQYVESHSASHPVPCVVQSGRIGATTVLYQPDGSLAARHIGALGAAGMAAYFSTDEEWDTKIQVVDHGRLIRTLDPFAALTEHHRGALPQEAGLRIGHGAPFAVSWALLERLSLTHITQNWLVSTEHPTYVIESSHC